MHIIVHDSEGLRAVDAKTANARSASHSNDDISQQPAALQDGGRSTAGEDRTGDETWVHCYQPESKQASKQWKHKESPTPTKFNVLLSTRKVKATVFWDMIGILLVEFQEHGGTVNVVLYYSLIK